MTKRRRLSDLYVRGGPLSVDDGEGAVDVWISKLNPVDHDTVLRRANAARARFQMVRNDRDSEEYQAAFGAMADLAEADSNDLVTFLINKNLAEYRASVEAETAAEDEWAEDDYLQGLLDSWRELRDVWVKDSEDVEAKRVYEEIKRFNEIVAKAVDAEAERLRRDWADADVNALVLAATDAFLVREGEDRWMDEYNRAALWKSVRDPKDHRAYYFESRAEVDQLAEPVFRQLLTAFLELTVEPAEGKGSVETPASSTSSEQSAEVGTAASSGLQVAAL